MESKVKNSSTISTKDLLCIETRLLFSMDSAYTDGWAEGSEKDKMIYKAFSAVQDLRKYLERKEESK